MGNAGWRSKALSRMTATTKMDVDSQSVLRERSPGTRSTSTSGSRSPWTGSASAVRAGPADLAPTASTGCPSTSRRPRCPTGYLVPIGDGAADVQPSACAKKPDSKVQIYKAGYVFRDGPPGIPRTPPTTPIRYGPGVKFHGHEDHLGVTYYAQGRPILTEAGFHSYEPSPYRDWTLSPQAHNVPIPQGAQVRPATASTPGQEVAEGRAPVVHADRPGLRASAGPGRCWSTMTRRTSWRSSTRSPRARWATSGTSTRAVGHGEQRRPGRGRGQRLAGLGGAVLAAGLQAGQEPEDRVEASAEAPSRAGSPRRTCRRPPPR